MKANLKKETNLGIKLETKRNCDCAVPFFVVDYVVCKQHRDRTKSVKQM